MIDIDGIDIELKLTTSLFFAEGIDEVIIASRSVHYKTDVHFNIYVPLDSDYDETQAAIERMKGDWNGTNRQI